MTDATKPPPPTFTLDATDPRAPAVVRYWARTAARTGVHETIWRNALAVADRMDQWYGAHIAHRPPEASR